MASRRAVLTRKVALCAVALVTLPGLLGTSARAATPAGLEDDGGASWRLEPVTPPELPDGESASTPIGLGSVGDIEFDRPGRGLLITAGNGSTIPPGVWAFDGLHWHELSVVCGASDGRIAWAGPEEFWTVSDERPGQAADSRGTPAPTADDSLCRFSGGSVVASYAAPAFQATSYQAMHAAACLSAGDCWFAGDALPEPQVGSFHLHWNGRAGTLEEDAYPGEGRPVEDMTEFGGSLYESVRISSSDPVVEHLAEPPALHLINPIGVSPTFEPLAGLPLYGPGEFPQALDALQLSAAGESLWAAAGPRRETPEGSEPATVTVDRYAAATGWQQLLGPLSGAADPFPGETVRSIAAEPQSEAAWVALAPSGEQGVDPNATALVARVSPDGAVTDEQTLPSAAEIAEGVGPKGAAAKISCPAVHECWLVTTEGWLFRLTALAPGSTTPEGLDTDPAFAGLITYRPPDTGLPAEIPDTPPEDDSGAALGEAPTVVESPASTHPRVTVALVSKVKVSVVHRTTLELRFHLTVRARVRLLARRHHAIVSATPSEVLRAGFHTLRLRLQTDRWPTKLEMQTHALAPLPTVAVNYESGAAIEASVRRAAIGGRAG
jgi:hypothetical protein